MTTETTPEQEAKWLPVAQQILDRWNVKHESLKGTIAMEIAGIVREERERCAKLAHEIDIQLLAYPSPDARDYFETGSLDAGIAIADHIRSGLEPGHVREVPDKLTILRNALYKIAQGGNRVRMDWPAHPVTDRESMAEIARAALTDAE